MLSSASAREKFFMIIIFWAQCAHTQTLSTILSILLTEQGLGTRLISTKGRAYKPKRILQLYLPSLSFSSSLMDGSQSCGQVDPEHPPPHGIVAFFMQHLLSLLASSLLQGFCHHML